MKKQAIKEGFDFLKKSKLKAADGNESGLYPFYTSSKILSKYTDNPIYPPGCLVLGTGGKANIHLASLPFSTSGDCIVITPKDAEKIDIIYVYNYFNANMQILEVGFKGAGLKHISKDYISRILIPTPPVKDQIRAAILLSRVEALITIRKNNLQQLDDFLKSNFLDMFGDPVRSEKEWDRVPLTKFGSISTGNTPPRKDSSNYGGSFIEWIKTDNIDKELLYVRKAQEYLTKTGAKKGRLLKKGALLVACIAGSIESIGRAAITDRDIAFNQQINAIQPNSSVDPIWLYWLFRISKKYIQNIPAKGMKKIITKGVFEKIELIKPPLDVQITFTKIATKGDELKKRLRYSLQELENLYAALSQRAFKCELDLSRIPMPEESAPKSLETIVVTDEISQIVEYPMSNPQTRKDLLRSLFDDYLKTNKNQPLMLEDFWQKASFKATDMMDEFDKPWNADDYDQVKEWLFEMIRDDKLDQTFVEEDKQIQLKVKA